MNSRKLTLVSTATVFGALAPAASQTQFLAKRHRSKKCSSQSPFEPSKRKGYLTWDDYFMAIAFLSAERSEDPNRQVGACLVSQCGIILGENEIVSQEL
ncbi:uncharacterized protein LOC126794255 [Argentina anserina]|uniref:uncharacterized protein LOC126794255 n=1 Tax=Argentina anserina TaxID=57926 RepID=UPI00217667A6|nr:uncharacterized protein LOC126794255 [Potentilla anserina]